MRHTALAVAIVPLHRSRPRRARPGPGVRHDRRSSLPACRRACKSRRGQQLRRDRAATTTGSRSLAPGARRDALQREGRRRHQPHLGHDRVATARAEPPRPDPAHVLGRRVRIRASRLPVGDFFGQGWDESYPFSVLPLAAGPREGRAMVSYFPMPFASGARIEIENDSASEGGRLLLLRRLPGDG